MIRSEYMYARDIKMRFKGHFHMCCYLRVCTVRNRDEYNLIGINTLELLHLASD